MFGVCLYERYRWMRTIFEYRQNNIMATWDINIKAHNQLRNNLFALCRAASYVCAPKQIPTQQ